MKTIGRLFSLLTLCLFLAACSHTGKGEPNKPEATPPAAAAETEVTPTGNQPVATGGDSLPSPKEIPFDYASLQEDVLIQLQEEPRLHSPIGTVVTPQPQQYALFFREPMDRGSVEEALKKQAQLRTTENPNALVPSFAFNWANDRQLHLTVEVPAAEKPDNGVRSYLLDVKGAKTKNGRILAEPPQFFATLYTPGQLWRVSIDGTRSERLTSFEQPYFSLQFLDEEQRYLLLNRFMQYCECDADHERMYAIYDLETKQLIPYPLELDTVYMGEGSFVADRRGFFHAKPASGATVPPSDTAVSIDLDEYVHGASFSKDHSRLLLAVGKKGQEADFDLLIRNLETGEEQRLSNALKGRPEENDLYGGNMPVRFYDDGTQVIFSLRHKTEQRYTQWRYLWQTNEVKEWKPPVQDGYAPVYSSSSDGLYQLYGSGLYKGEEKITDWFYGSGHWLNGTHTLVFSEYSQAAADNATFLEIKLYDADQRSVKTVLTKLNHGTVLLGPSRDGKWIYLQSSDDLAKNTKK
jgi:hypothetical protein